MSYCNDDFFLLVDDSHHHRALTLEIPNPLQWPLMTAISLSLATTPTTANTTPQPPLPRLTTIERSGYMERLDNWLPARCLHGEVPAIEPWEPMGAGLGGGGGDSEQARRLSIYERVTTA